MTVTVTVPTTVPATTSATPPVMDRHHLSLGLARPAEVLPVPTRSARFVASERAYCQAWGRRPDRWLGRLAAKRAVADLYHLDPAHAAIVVTTRGRSRPTVRVACTSPKPATSLSIAHCATLGLALGSAPFATDPEGKGPAALLIGVDVVALARPLLADPDLRELLRRRVTGTGEATPELGSPAADLAGVVAAKEAAVKAVAAPDRRHQWLDVRLEWQRAPGGLDAVVARLLASAGGTVQWAGRAQVHSGAVRRCCTVWLGRMRGAVGLLVALAIGVPEATASAPSPPGSPSGSVLGTGGSAS